MRTKNGVKKLLRSLGLKNRRPRPTPFEKRASIPTPTPIEPVWPLPRREHGPTDDEIRSKFAEYDLWHYAFQFEGGIRFSTKHNQAKSNTGEPERPLQRFRHFMPYLVDAQNGSLQGKRVLDIACNSGFWSIQCALLGAEVVGFDARDELIEQAKLIKSIVGVDNVDFKILDFWDMSPETLGGTFDVVLNLGVLYHLPSPLEALSLTKKMSRSTIVLDTTVAVTDESVIKLKWEEPSDIRFASTTGVVASPSKSAVDLLLSHLRFSAWFEIPIHSDDMPGDYLAHNRATWLIRV